MTVLIRSIASELEWLEWRQHDVTASEISALTGDHPFLTKYGLWQLKAGKIEREPENEEMKRGRKLEPVAMEMAFEDHPEWGYGKKSIDLIKSGREKNYLSDRSLRIGASPDAVLFSDSWFVLEIKTLSESAFKEHWEDGSPLHILDQIRIGMWLADVRKGTVAAMVITYSGQLRMHYFDVVDDEKPRLHYLDHPEHEKIVIECHPRVHRLIEETQAFWQSITNGIEPEPDFGRDLDLIRKTPLTGAEIDLTGDNEILKLRDNYALHSVAETFNKKQKDEIKARILHKMKGASTAIFDGQPIARVSMIRKKERVVKESTYPMLRFVNQKGESSE